MSVLTARLPIAIVSSAICFALGVGAGMGTMIYKGYHWEKEPAKETSTSGMAKMISDGPGGGKGGPGGGMAKGPGGGGGGQRGPSPKTLLASLVTKLDLLTQKPLRVELSPEQKKQVSEQLKGLTEPEELSDDDASKRLEALKEVLKDKVETLEAAGYRFPGQGGPGGAPGPGGGRPAPNPFKEDAAGQHLKSLEAQLAKGAA